MNELLSKNYNIGEKAEIHQDDTNVFRLIFTLMKWTRRYNTDVRIQFTKPYCQLSHKIAESIEIDATSPSDIHR